MSANNSLEVQSGVFITNQLYTLSPSSGVMIACGFCEVSLVRLYVAFYSCTERKKLTDLHWIFLRGPKKFYVVDVFLFTLYVTQEHVYKQELSNMPQLRHLYEQRFLFELYIFSNISPSFWQCTWEWTIWAHIKWGWVVFVLSGALIDMPLPTD